MQSIKKYNAIILSIIVVSCVSNTSSDLIIDLSKGEVNIELSDFVDSVKYVQLETNSNSIISKINHIIKDDTTLFILDKKQKSLFLFNHNGEYLRKINSVGRGPGEYIAFSSFCLDKPNKKIYILDGLQRKILKFNYNANFEDEIEFDKKEVVSSFAYIPNGNFLFITPYSLNETNNNDGIWEVDHNGVFIKQWHKAAPDFKWVWYSDPEYSLCKNEICYYDCYTDEIYRYKDYSLRKDLSIELLQKMPSRIFKRPVPNENNLTEGYYICGGFTETTNCYFLQYYSSVEGLKHVVIDKNRNQKKIFKKIVNNTDTITIDRFFNFDSHSIVIPLWTNEESNPNLQVMYIK